MVKGNEETASKNFRVDLKDWDKLATLSNKLDKTIAAFVREGIRLVLEKYKDEIKDQEN